MKRVAFFALAATLVVAGCGEKKKVKLVAPKVVERSMRVHIYPSAQRLRPTQHIGKQSNPSIKLTAARGEFEGAQIGLRSKKHAARIAAKVTGLDLPYKLYEERSVEVKNASPNGATGWYFDPLLPVAETVVVGSEQATALWLDIHVPVHTKPGTHSGSLTIGEGKHAVAIPISVDVGVYALPDKPALSTSIGVDQSQILRFEKPGKSHAAIAKMMDRYYKILAAARLTPADWYTPPSIGEDRAAYDSSPFATEFNTAIQRRGINEIRVPWYITYPYKDPLGKDRKRTLAYLRNVAKYFKASGLMEHNYVYVVDEPTAKDAKRVHEMAKLAHEADPAFRVLLTHEPAKPFLRGNDIDIWAANISQRVDEKDIAAAHKRGEKYWWYPGISTHAPYPTLFIDDTRPSPRALGTLAFEYHVDGFLYYSATHWHEVKDPWTEVGTWHNPDGAIGNGDGVLLYPGKPVGHRGPLPSVRLLMLRDGIEDFETLTHLEGVMPSATKPVEADLTYFETDPKSISDRHRNWVVPTGTSTG